MDTPYSVKGEITAQITDEAVRFQSKIENMVLSQWGFTKRDVEDALVELAEYRKAEEQGLLVKLPCKVGDTVWMLTTTLDVKTGKLNSGITTATITQLRGNKFNPIWYIVQCSEGNRDFHPSQIGKSVFLTGEAAESALKGGEGE